MKLVHISYTYTNKITKQHHSTTTKKKRSEGIAELCENRVTGEKHTRARTTTKKKIQQPREETAHVLQSEYFCANTPKEGSNTA